jgi:DNA-directed RNA polymerase sigma subunit (sigma70/sigma32)
MTSFSKWFTKNVYVAMAFASSAARGRLNQLLLRRVLADLDHQARWLLQWRYGLGCPAVSDEILSRRLSLSQDEIYALESEALEQIGFALVTEVF